MILAIRLHTGIDYMESLTLDEILDMAQELKKKKKKR